MVPGLVPPRKQYFEGPKRETTEEWKQLVRDALANNRKMRMRDETLTALSHPRSHAELADAIEDRVGQRPDPSAITLMLSRKANVSGLVDATCEVLSIPPPKSVQPVALEIAQPDDATDQLVPQLSEEDLYAVIRMLRDMLPPEKRAKALRVIRAMAEPDHADKS